MGDTGDSSFNMRALCFALVVMLLLPVAMTTVCPTHAIDVDTSEIYDGYYEMTGQTMSTKTSVWALTGIYTPYAGNAASWTSDGWLYGSEVKAYTPSQYASTPTSYNVQKGSDGLFRYSANSADYNQSAGLGHAQGDLYTMVNFDVAQQSSIFFTEGGRTDVNGHFYYSYDGYRMAFQPIANYTTQDANGNQIPIVATTTSLSLIWYHYWTSSGVAGMLVLSGNSGGVSYLNSAQIVAAFSQSTYSSTFAMVFNGGVQMDVIIRIDPTYLSQGLTVAECYDRGYWSIMVTSQSVDADAYTGTDSAMNPAKILSTAWALFTFDLGAFNLSPILAALASAMFVLPLYMMLLTFTLSNYKLLILWGILAAIQSFSILGF